MSWETQGRQYHAWFGHGTADQDGPASAEAGKGDVVAEVISGAAGLMPGERRAAFEHYLSSGGQAKLEKAIPIWAASSGMSAADFRGKLVGGGLGDEGALALQAMARSLAGGSAGPDVAGASGQLAAAVTSASSAGWRYGLSFAGSQAIYAEANGLVVPSSNQPGQKSPFPGSSKEAARPVSKRTDRWSECHEYCADKSVDKGFKSDAPLIYLRCMWECGAFE